MSAIILHISKQIVYTRVPPKSELCCMTNNKHTCHDSSLHVTHVGLPEPGLGEDVHKHGRGPVDRGALLRLDGLDTGGAVEAGAGDHVGGAVQEPAEGAGHIAEAVIERDGDTDSVRLKQRVINKGQFRDGASYFLIIAYPVADLMRIVD